MKKIGIFCSASEYIDKMYFDSAVKSENGWEKQAKR